MCVSVQNKKLSHFSGTRDVRDFTMAYEGDRTTLELPKDLTIEKGLTESLQSTQVQP